MSSPPNIIYIFSDEWRAQATGYNQDPNCETPVLDSFARQSQQVTHAVSGCSVCCPYRASLLTGQYPLTHGVFINDVELNPDCHSIARAFGDQGYHTAWIGKWHVYGSPDGKNERRAKPVPRSHQMGFDEWMGFECTHNYLQSGYFHNENPTLQPWGDYDAFAQSRAAVDYMKDRAETENPFLLMLSWGPPHFPLNNAPEKYQQLYANRDIKLRENVPEPFRELAVSELRGYYAHIAALDHALEIVLTGIQDAGLAENTLVVFTSDHGDMRQSQGLATKCFPWDESIRVPFLLHDPRHPEHAGTSIPLLIDAPDIMPTLLGLCDFDIPESVEGKSYAQELSGIREPDPDDAAFLNMSAEFTEIQYNEMCAYRGIRTRRYTYVRNTEGPWLLYDNQTDPYQKNNLIEDPDAVELQARMEHRLQQMLLDRKDAFLPSNTYLERAGLTHYRETQCQPLQIWRDPWKSSSPQPVPNTPIA